MTAWRHNEAVRFLFQFTTPVFILLACWDLNSIKITELFENLVRQLLLAIGTLRLHNSVR